MLYTTIRLVYLCIDMLLYWKKVHFILPLLLMMISTFPVEAYDIAVPCDQGNSIDATICRKEEDYYNRVVAFSRDYRLPPLEHIIRYKQSLDLYDEELASYCDTLNAINEQGACRDTAGESVQRMEVVLRGMVLQYSEYQRTYFFTNQLEQVANAMERITRTFQDITTMVAKIKSKLDYINHGKQ